MRCLAKCEEYHAWGVPYCWVINAEKRTGWEYHVGGEPTKIDRAGVLRAAELAVPLADRERPRQSSFRRRL